ncbi:MAG TPA: hypothetical protein VGS06_36195 [Streptosporangiaceae bacterium]|nr:hypothetical protein [Streptosporangiaceae bacterium]
MSFRSLKAPVTFGSADGLTVVMGLIVTLAGEHHALWRAAVGAGLAELVGMTAGQWLSDGDGGFRAALANGSAAAAACIIPALPYAAAGGLAALLSSLTLVTGVAAAISWLRPERGILAVVQTYGVLIAAAALCTAAAAI